jgi:hypothetical protein
MTMVFALIETGNWNNLPINRYLYTSCNKKNQGNVIQPRRSTVETGILRATIKDANVGLCKTDKLVHSEKNRCKLEHKHCPASSEPAIMGDTHMRRKKRQIGSSPGIHGPTLRQRRAPHQEGAKPSAITLRMKLSAT